jgi:hypothetical protein
MRSASVLVFALAVVAMPVAAAEPASCESPAVSHAGEPLNGAAKEASMRKCINERVQACEGRAIGKNDKPLSGAARTAFLDKCNADNGALAWCESRALSKEGKPLSGAAKKAVVKKCLAGG